MIYTEILTAIFFTLFGLFIGSFLNVCIYRLPRGNFFSKSRSYCPCCRNQIVWYDNIPLISWFVLGGRCRNCKEKISIRYPAIEAINMVLWLVCYLVLGFSIGTVILCIVFSILLVMSMIDIDIQEIPNALILSIVVLAIPYVFASGLPLWEHILGAFVMSIPLFVVGIITGGIGGGDIKLLFATGILLGYKLTLVAGLAGIIIGALVGVVLLISRKAGRKTAMPLGPALASGFVIAALWGNQVFDWYIGLI